MFELHNCVITKFVNSFLERFDRMKPWRRRRNFKPMKLQNSLVGTKAFIKDSLRQCARLVKAFGTKLVHKRSPHTFATPFLASLRLPALPRTRFGVNGLGMRRATILESGVVIRFEFFELQPFKVDQFFRGFFRDFPTLITLKYIQK